VTERGPETHGVDRGAGGGDGERGDREAGGDETPPERGERAATSWGSVVGGGDGVALIGHRGCAAQCPENTVAAVERAGPRVDAVEVDVRRCASGELVVFHDAALGRLTDATGTVAETDWSDLRALTVGGSDEPIPRIESLLAAVPEGTGVNVELKASGTAADALAAVRDAGVPTLFSSFLPTELARLRELAPATDRALLVAEADAGDAVESAVDLGCAALHPPIDAATEPGFVGVAREAGLAVNAWTAADRADAERLLAAGVDGVIADRWDVLSAAERPSRG
jgi:glycerophosphoryl diester phosphodiesterase